MARFAQECAQSGSQKWLQLAVNEYADLLVTPISEYLHPKTSEIEWLSPLACDDFAEYRDEDFIDLLGLELATYPLSKFWPKVGPQWDGLARTDRSQVLMVEAKSYAAELAGKGSQATNCDSIRKIRLSLEQTQLFLDATPSVEWAQSPYYQYANRLAHLYLLAELNGIDAYLLMVYFLNDVEMDGPHSPSAWRAAIQKMYIEMGLPQKHALSDRIVDLFVDVHNMMVVAP